MAQKHGCAIRGSGRSTRSNIKNSKSGSRTPPRAICSGVSSARTPTNRSFTLPLWRCWKTFQRKGRDQDMQIGEPLRTIVVEPLEVPVQQPAAEPETFPASAQPEPEQVPVAQ